MCLQYGEMTRALHWYYNPNTTLQNGSPTLLSLLQDYQYVSKFKLAVYDLQWKMNSLVDEVDAAVEDARQRVKNVLNNYSSEVRHLTSG